MSHLLDNFLDSTYTSQQQEPFLPGSGSDGSDGSDVHHPPPLRTNRRSDLRWTPWLARSARSRNGSLLHRAGIRRTVLVGYDVGMTWLHVVYDVLPPGTTGREHLEQLFLCFHLLQLDEVLGRLGLGIEMGSNYWID